MKFWSGKKTYILGVLIAVIGILAGSSTISMEAAEQIITILLGLMGITLRQAVSKLIR